MKMILNKGKVVWSYALSYKVKMTILSMNRDQQFRPHPACAAEAASARRRPGPLPRGEGEAFWRIRRSWSQCLCERKLRLSLNRTAKKASSPQPSPPEEDREKAYGDLCATICLPRPARNERGEGLFQGSPKPRAISFFSKGVVV